MVFEHLAAFFVDKFLGNYIEDIDSHQLKISLWNGNITLENIQLKTNALNNLNVPIEILTGYLEKLEIHIPWKHLYSNPTKIQIDGFYLLLAPKTDINSDPEQAEEEEYQSKMKQVEKIEKFRREREFYEMNKTNPHHKDTFIQRLQFHILRNIEIEIKNIHIAFYDKTTKSYPFQFGITLNYIQLNTTKNESDDSNIIYKFGEINNLSIYWNSNLESTKQDFIEQFKFHEQSKYPKMNYIVEPMNVRAKLKIGKIPEEQDFKQPIVDIQFDFDQIYFNINKNQYSDLLDLLEFENYLNSKRKYIKYHSIIQNNPDEKLTLKRWKFAYEIILNETVRPRLSSFKWEKIQENLTRYKEYRQIYLDQLNHQFIKQHKQTAKKLEKQIDIFNLISIRRIVQIEYKKNKLEEKEMSWWEKLHHWWNNSDQENQELQFNESLTTEEKLQFYESIGYKDEPSSQQLIYPEEYVDIQFSLKFSLIKINVWSFINENDSNLKVIGCVSIGNTEVEYQRRPQNEDFLLKVDINSIEMFGIEAEELSLSRPILIQPFQPNENKLFYIEFETNPLNRKVDYRIKCFSQSLQLNYHQSTILKLIQCFLPDRHHHLEGLKEVAYSIYTDIKHRTQFLVNENLKKIQDLDINIDLQSIYFIIPQNGSLQNFTPIICLDSGHLSFKGGETNIQIEVEGDIFHDAKSTIDDQDKTANNIPLKIQLENVQLLYLYQNENWIDIRLKSSSRSHLIKPITLAVDILKSRIIDNPKIPIWTFNGQILSIESRLSDTRLSAVIKLIQSITFLDEDPQQQQKEEKKSQLNTKETNETIEKVLYEYEKEIERNFKEEQLIQLKASFQINKVEIVFERALLDLSDYTEEFIRIYLFAIVTSMKMSTYDIEFNGYLQDFLIQHEQFLTDDKQKMKILSKMTNSNLFEINCLLTSKSNPLFNSSPYDSIENKIYLKLNRFIINLQSEVISSIIHFKNKLTNQIRNKKSNSSNIENQSSSSSSSSSFKLNINLEEINLFIGNNQSQILYIKLTNFNGYLSKTNLEILSKFILNNFSVIDLYPKSYYQYIITKENSSNDLIQFDLSLINNNSKTSYLKGQIEKLNIIFLSKHIRLILSIINLFQTKKQNSSSNQNQEENFLSSILQKYQQNSIEIDLNFIFNCPNIFIPLNSYSKQGLNIDLGKLILNTDSSEKHLIKLENISIQRIISNETNRIYLLECSPFIISINRQLSIQIQWDSIDFKIDKSDYETINKIFQQNFKENILYKIPQIDSNDQQNYSTKQISKKSKSSPEIKVDFIIKQISLTFYLDQNNNQLSRDDNSKFIYLTIQMIQAFFQQSSDSTYNGKLQIQHLFADHLKQNNQYSRFINKAFHVDENASLLIANLNYQNSTTTVNGEMESFNILINPDLINSINEFFNCELSTKAEEKSFGTNNIEIADIPSAAKSISQYKQLQHQESSSSSSIKSIKNDQPASPKRPSSSSSSTDVATNIEFVLKPSHIILIENPNKDDSNCLVFNLSLSMHMMNNGDEKKISSSIKDLSFYGSNFEQLKDSKVKYSIIEPSQINAMLMINSQEQKIDLELGDLSINIDPILIRTFVSLSNSIKKQEKPKSNTGKEKINSKSIFDPKPFKDSTFWYLQDSEEKEELLEKADLLELTTGEPSQKKNQIKQKNEQKSIEKYENLKQQLIIKLNIIEVKLELGKGLSTRPVVALCLSNIFANIENWSTDILISSSIQIELALFNDHLLAWEPLIEPIIDERGIVESPWTIYCETIQNEQDQNDEQNRYLLSDEYSSESESSKNENHDVKKLISIRGEHLLNVILTKTTLDLSQRIQTMFDEVYKKGLSSDDDQQQAILSIINQTGFNIQIDQIIGVEFPNGNEEIINLKNNELIDLTIPRERLDATHLPAIVEQISKRKQQFQIKIEDKELTVDINQTWRRVYELYSSSNPSWPIQLLCDSQVYQERRRVVLSSIIKISNRTLLPLLILDGHSIETNQFNIVEKVNPNEEVYLPIQLIYFKSTTKIYFSFQQEEESNEEINDFISFDWSNESITDRIFKLNNGKQANYVIYKEEIEAYSSNTDEPTRKSFNIYVKYALHLLNLLPIPIQCSIDNIENALLNPSELYHTIEGNKKSVLIFKIDEYNNSSWISQPIDLNSKGHGIHNEYIIQFNNQITNDILRIVLRVDTYRGSFRASLYSPFWIINSTDLKFQFKIDNDKIFLDATDKPCLICPKHFDSQSKKKKGHIRVFSIEDDENISQWSESFSLDVIKSTGITSCQVKNDRTYMICIDIVTCSFGMTKIITLIPSTAIINNSTIDIEINENIDDTNWKLIKANQVIPYWPRYIKEGVLHVRYNDDKSSLNSFSIKEKQLTLLRMNNEERPAMHVEVTATDFDGYKVIFNDYRIGDAPLLIVNGLNNQNIVFSQKDDLQTQLLPSEYYVYYTWMDTFKPRELIILTNQTSHTVQLAPSCGILDKQSENRIYYAVFYDGPQTVLIFTQDVKIIESVSDISSLNESMDSYIEISLNSIGISIINDIKRDDLFYITINPSKQIWMETNKFHIKPVSPKLHQYLDHHYKDYLKDQSKQDNKYEIDKNRVVRFDDDIAEISDLKGNRIIVKHEILDGFWFGYRWSTTNKSIHMKINHLQIDNQLQISLFPTILYPIISKSAATDIPGKSFIELSLFKSESTRSNTIQIKYLKLLIQEFVACIDQGLILGIMSFIQTEKNPAAPSVNMDTDLQRLSNPLERIVRDENQNSSGETKIYFDNLHLSPLKIHVSFSMHGSKASEQLLAEYPLLDFLLQILNIAEVQDVILKLNYYERKNDRYTITKLTKEISDHYENQFLKQLHVVVLGLDVLGNPFGVIRGVAEGVESFFYEPYKGAMEGPIEFLEGIATGTRNLFGSVVGGAAGALSKVTQATSKGLATLTLDHNYQNARIQRKEIQSQTTPELIASGKNAMKDVVLGVKGVVKKPVQGAKHGGTKGFAKGLGKGFLGLIGRPASGITDLTSTSFKLIKRVATNEQIVHRLRNPRHIGRDGLVRPSIPHETLGNYLFERFDDEYHSENEGYIAHIDSSANPSTLLFATTKRILFLIENENSSNEYRIEWNYYYKDIKGDPIVKFNPNFIQITIKETNLLGMTKKDSLHIKVVPYDSVGEARYIVDKIIETTKIFEV